LTKIKHGKAEAKARNFHLVLAGWILVLEWLQFFCFFVKDRLIDMAAGSIGKGYNDLNIIIFSIFI
jgi:hypothetical protein